MGYWSNHKYQRRSVTKDSEKGFLGWNWIENQLDKYRGQKAQRNRALFLTIFKTGGRINEVLSLKRSNITQDEDYIIVVNMMKEKDSEYETYFPLKIPKKEPLNKEWVDWINQSRSWLFPSSKKDDKPLSYIRAYQIITKRGTYPHFLRSQRSSMEIAYYKIKARDLVDSRQWKTDRMVKVYASAEARQQIHDQMLEKFREPLSLSNP